MEVEGFTNQQIFDTMVKLVNDQKAEAAAALADHKREALDLHDITMAALGEIRDEIGVIHARLEGGDPKPTAASAPASTPPLTPRDGEACPDGLGDDKLLRGKVHDTSGVYVPPPVRGAQGSRHPTFYPDAAYHSFRRTDSSSSHHRDTESHTQHRSLPKVDFPKFDGECPKLWQQRCKDYFAGHIDRCGLPFLP
jgi:hypothetical protein